MGVLNLCEEGGGAATPGRVFTLLPCAVNDTLTGLETVEHDIVVSGVVKGAD